MNKDITCSSVSGVNPAKLMCELPSVDILDYTHKMDERTIHGENVYYHFGTDQISCIIRAGSWQHVRVWYIIRRLVGRTLG